MSSHHIVRENQEPALIVSAYNELEAEYIGQLLEWSPTVITNDDTVDFFLAAGMKIDVVFSAKEAIYPQEQIKVFSIQKGFIPDALDYAIQHHHKAINIVGNVVDDITAYCHLINIVVLFDGTRYVYVRERYEKWKEAGARMFIAEQTLKSLVGIKKVGPDTFVVEQDGFIYLEFNADEYVCIGEEI